MTYEEALEICKAKISKSSYLEETSNNRGIATINSNKVDFLIIVRKALEKQIPKKLITKEFDDEDEETKEQFKWTFYLCPVCGENVALKSYTHCHCGQALDWSEYDG